MRTRGFAAEAADEVEGEVEDEVETRVHVDFRMKLTNFTLKSTQLTQTHHAEKFNHIKRFKALCEELFW
jgi:hypothetical protein|tara:strand:+ start:4866 stop:5072 length:207 start_codon:yes stop_codon:yes gene_type:complete